MKRLLLPLLAALALPTAVNAFWKNDLSVDFNGENYSLNKKPTKEKVFTLADYEKSYKSIYNMDNPNFVFNTPSLIEACAKKGLSFMYESELAKCKKKAENYEKGLKYIKHIEYAYKTQTKVLYKFLTFNPTITYSNKQKTELGENAVICLNPELKPKTVEVLNFFNRNHLTKAKPNTFQALNLKLDSTRPIDQLKKKICEKYAKFE